MNVRILILVNKNTSVLDFLLPVFARIPHLKKNVEISILYTCLNKRAILRETRFYSEICSRFGVRELDYADISESRTLIFLKPLFSASMADAPSFGEVKKTRSLRDLCLFFRSRLLQRLEKFLLNCFLDFEGYLNTLQADQILLENRAGFQFSLSDQLTSFLEKKKSALVLLPHAPHYIDETDCFAPLPFGENGLPKYARVWIPFLATNPGKKYPNQSDQFVYVGYPGFDQEWIQLCAKEPSRLSAGKNILFIGRKFYSKGVRRWNPSDFVTLEYEEVLSTLTAIRNTLNEFPDCHFVFKAHPSSRYSLIEQVLKEAGFTRYQITYEPFYSLLAETRVVISNYSTSILIPALTNVPVVLINSPLQQQVNQHWQVVADMYNSFEFFARNPAEARDKATLILQNKLTGKRDCERLRKLFPEGASQRALTDLHLE